MDANAAATRQSNPQHYPKAWKAYINALKKGKTPSDFGFKGSDGQVVRFASRFRVAKAFQSMELDGYRQATVEGYSALLKVFLCWSAFEQFIDLLGVEQRNLAPLLQPYHPDEIIKQIKSIDRNRSFYDFLYAQVNQPHRRELDNYFRDDLKNVTYLASAIRHIFVHGLLTPHANQTRPQKVVKIGAVISEFLLHVMDEEFDKRVNHPSKMHSMRS